jgi:hypothetical protein
MIYAQLYFYKNLHYLRQLQQCPLLFDVKDVILNNIKFDMFKWFHPTKVDYVRDRLTFYGFKEDKNMYITSQMSLQRSLS